MLLAFNVLAGLYALQSLLYLKVRSYFVVSVLLANPFLLVRGIYGVVACFVDRLDSFSLENYTSTGMDPVFVITKYVLATTMEFIAAFLLLSTFYLSKRESSKVMDVMVGEETPEEHEEKTEENTNNRHN